MTNAHTKTHAASGGQGHRLARLARRGIAVCVLACAGIGAAQAQYHGRRDDAQLPPPPSARAERLAVPPHMERDRGFDQQRDYQQQQQREERRQAVQQMQQEGAREGGRRGGRLTPDERRELRRQVNEAGMDIYPHRERR